MPEGPKLVVVAHPDDEFIFAHNAITTVPGPWAVVCLTNPGNGRDLEFIRSGEALRFTPVQFSYKDGLTLGIPVERAAKKLSKIASGFSAILSHNERGEYGHPQHKAAHRIAKKVATVNNIPLFVFGFNDMPQFYISSKTKSKSECRKIYAREAYMIDNFDMVTETYLKVDYEECNP